MRHTLIFGLKQIRLGIGLRLSFGVTNPHLFSLFIQSMSEGMLGNLSLAILQAFELGVTEEKFWNAYPNIALRPCEEQDSKAGGELI